MCARLAKSTRCATIRAMPGRLTLDALEALVKSDQVDTVLTVVPDGFGRFMGKRRVHLTFQGQLADEPAIWTMSQQFGLVFSIRQADLEDGFGWIMLELEGDAQKLADALRWLEERGVIVAPIEQDVVAG